MRSTLFFIPHELAPGWPLFGFGVLLAFLVLLFVAWAIWQLKTGRSIAELLAGLPFWLLTAAVIVFVLPRIEQTWPDGSPIGLPIRGYGIMVLLGLLSGIGICVYRGSQLGIASDTIVGLGFWMMLGGVLGARIFYVVQKWEEFSTSFASIFMITEGGLVIYGGVIGGLVACVIYCRRHHLNIAATGDLVAPGFLIGLAFGRIGCLLHGCCFGGVCVSELPAIQFPHGSGPYLSQAASGELLGLKLSDDKMPAKVVAVEPSSPGDEKGISVGDQVNSIALHSGQPNASSDPTQPLPLIADVELSSASSTRHRTFMPEDLPAQSLPVHPSQIYAAINALLLCVLVWFIQPVAKQDGMTFLIAVLLYAISRYLLEGVRSDEAGQLGTQFTIAQLVSMVSGAITIGGIIFLSRRPAKRVWNWGAQNAG